MEALNDRKKAILSKIIEEYVATAKPVSSNVVVEKYGLEVSSATIRNDMQELEELGFLSQPHTSAGRIPTEQGYRYYIQHFINKNKELRKRPKDELSQLAHAAEHLQPEPFVKTLAKGMAELSDETVLVSFDPTSFYYTGIANIFRKPEFSDVEVMYSLSELVDHLDEMMAQLPRVLSTDDVNIFVGHDNPISADCSAIVAQSSLGTIAILGPMRMDYQFNYELLKYVRNIFNTLNN